MSRRNAWLCGYLLLTCCVLPMLAQQPVASATNGSNVVVPPLVNFSTVLTDLNGKPLSKLTGVTFLLYKEEQGGAPLWMETQNVQPDKTGHYSVMLGSTTSTGLPGDLFVAGEARWLGVQPQGQAEQPRVMLLSVPYALKAGDAETLGGMPASAFVPAKPGAVGATPAGASEGKEGKVQSNANVDTITGSGTTNYVPLWTGSSTLGNSLLFQSGSDLGLGTTTPTNTLTVNKGSKVGAGIDVSGGNDTRVRIGVGEPTTWSWSNGWATPGDFSLIEEGKSGSRIYFKPGGNVGLGTSIPSTTLEVNKGTTAGGGIYIDGTTDTRVKIGVGQPTVWSWSNGWATPGEFSLIEEGASGSRIYFKPGGNVGIGTSTPGQKLSVAGVIQSSTGGFMFPDGSVQTQASTGGGGGVTSITAGLGLTGGTITTSGTIGIDTTVVPRLSAANTFNASQTINGNLLLNTVTALGGQFSGANGGVIGQDSETDSTVRYGVQGLANGVYGVGVRGGGYYGANVVPSSYYAGGGVGVFGAGALGVIGYAGPGVSNGSEGVYGQGPSFGVYSNGNFGATGTKSAVVPLPDNRVVLLYAMESPEVWFEDLGSATLKDGVAVITLDPTFALTVNTTVPYHVYVTPAGDCEGLYVTKKTPGSFEVRELRGGRSNTAFEYRVIGKRSGFEDRRLERLQADAETVRAMREQSRTRPTRVPSIKIREGAGSPEITSPKRNP